MPRLVSAPLITYKCNQCGAISEDDAEKFVLQNTMPPTWRNKCAFCNVVVVCSPPQLIAKLVNN